MDKYTKYRDRHERSAPIPILTSDDLVDQSQDKPLSSILKHSPADKISIRNIFIALYSDEIFHRQLKFLIGVTMRNECWLGCYIAALIASLQYFTRTFDFFV